MKTTYTWERITFDRVLSTSPVFISNIIVTPDAQAQADITLYDGESTGDPQIITVKSGTGITKNIHLNPALQTQRGLYIDIGSNVEEALVCYSWEKE